MDISFFIFKEQKTVLRPVEPCLMGLQPIFPTGVQVCIRMETNNNIICLIVTICVRIDNSISHAIR